MSSKVIVLSVGQVPPACAQETPCSNHHRVQPAVRKVRSASTLSVTARRSVARSFHRFSSRDRSAEKRPLAQLQWATPIREGCPRPTIAPDAFSSRTSMVGALWPKIGSAAAGLLRDGVRTATEVVLVLGCGAALVGSREETHSFLTYDHVSCFGAPIAGVSNFGTDSSTNATSEACCGLAESVASYFPPVDKTSPVYKHGWLPLLAPLWQRPSGPASP